jgi:integrase/recombinase XerD
MRTIARNTFRGFLAEQHHLSPNTVRSYAAALRPLDVALLRPGGCATPRALVQSWRRATTAPGGRSCRRHVHLVSAYFSWLCRKGVVAQNPLSSAAATWHLPLTVAARCLLERNPKEELARQAPQPRFASHLGDLMRAHVERMKTVGYRFRHASEFAAFDRFIQERPGAGSASFVSLAHEYLAAAGTLCAREHRMRIVRAVGKLLRRGDASIQIVRPEPRLASLAKREWRKPYIYSDEEITRFDLPPFTRPAIVRILRAG